MISVRWPAQQTADRPAAAAPSRQAIGIAKIETDDRAAEQEGASCAAGRSRAPCAAVGSQAVQPLGRASLEAAIRCIPVRFDGAHRPSSAADLVGAGVRRQASRRRPRARSPARAGARPDRAAGFSCRRSWTSAHIHFDVLRPPLRLQLARSRRGGRGGRGPCAQSSSRPWPVRPETVTTGGVQVGRGGGRGYGAPPGTRRPPRPRAAPASSALLTAIMSASSRMPFLMPCSSSPAPGSIRTRKKSVRSATAVSDWPTPDRLDQDHVEARRPRRAAWSRGSSPRRRRGCRRTGRGG